MARNHSTYPPRAMRRRLTLLPAGMDANAADLRQHRRSAVAEPDVSGARLTRADIDAILTHPCWRADS